MHKKIFILASLIFLCTAWGHSETVNLSPEKRADIIKLMKTSGVTNIASQVANTLPQHMVDLLIKASHREIPQRGVEIMKAEITNLFDEEMKSEKFYDNFIPIFDKYYSDKEIKELINFYDTDLGKKVVSVTPYVTQECMAAGKKWGGSLGVIAVKRITERLKAEGIDLKD
ncbi:MAG: DUF2059 domain-containing protein [Syntrophales bacterium]